MHRSNLRRLYYVCIYGHWSSDNEAIALILSISFISSETNFYVFIRSRDKKRKRKRQRRWRWKKKQTRTEQKRAKYECSLLTMNLILRAVLLVVGSVHFSKYMVFNNFSARISQFVRFSIIIYFEKSIHFCGRYKFGMFFFFFCSLRKYYLN